MNHYKMKNTNFCVCTYHTFDSFPFDENMYDQLLPCLKCNKVNI